MISEGMTKFLAGHSVERGAQGDTDCPKAPHARYWPNRYGNGIPLPVPTSGTGGFGLVKFCG